MIYGLQLKVSHEELRQHCLKRVEHHNRSADEKEKELPALRDAVARLESTQAAVPNTVSKLQQDIRDHRYKAVYFAFMAEHLFAEDYNLSENDLVRLEILRP